MKAGFADFFTSAVNAAQTDTGRLIIVLVFAVVVLAWIFPGGFDFRASFRPGKKHRR